MASSDKCPLKTNKMGEQQQPQERPKEWWKVWKDQNQNPPAYAHATTAPKPPTIDDLVS
jgi:hypothetical protein